VAKKYDFVVPAVLKWAGMSLNGTTWDGRQKDQVTENSQESRKSNRWVFCVAPMMDGMSCPRNALNF
jgi:hypothetical protein